MRATYRLQLGPGLDFRAAARLVPYLRELGISHLYLSPSLQARPGSTHGYDVTDPRRISEELGGEEAFRELASAGLDVLLDIVPNHMAASEENPFWADPETRLRVFDVDPETGWHRRFFTIGDLAGVRVEDPEVFALTHAKILELVRAGLVHGVRVDHPDGLARPGEYLERLRDAGVERVWVEKILEPGEQLPDWPVHGTTGYELANDATALLVDPAAEAPLTELYAEVTGERRPFVEIAAEAKREQAEAEFSHEVDRLARLSGLAREELVAAVAALPVYRTYLDGGVSTADEALVRALPPRVAERLLAEPSSEFTTRFQQTTGAVMAKGVEDTAFYRYSRLLALNEVGGDPGRFSLSVADFHRANSARAERFPLNLLATQTHDTKRSGDVRCRLAALSWIPDEWAERVAAWRRLAGPLRTGDAPDGEEEYHLYQTLVGAWPLSTERLEPYVEKALREAKRHTTWTEPSEPWERAVREFARGLLSHEPFLVDFVPFAERVAALGRHASLAQTLLKLTAPGVPDVYQGDELETLSLVDPDNRRPVDWARRSAALAAPLVPGGEKLHLVARTLALRARRPADFAGAYVPEDRGEATVAFRRGEHVLVVAPLRPGGEKRAPSGWRDLLPELSVGLYERRTAAGRERRPKRPKEAP